MLSMNTYSDFHSDTHLIPTSSPAPTSTATARPRKSSKPINSPAISSVRKNSVSSKQKKPLTSSPLASTVPPVAIDATGVISIALGGSASVKKKNSNASSKVSPPSHASSTLTSDIASFDLNDVTSSSNTHHATASQSQSNKHYKSNYSFQRPIDFSPSLSPYANDEGLLYHPPQATALENQIGQSGSFQDGSLNYENRLRHWNYLPSEIQKAVFTMSGQIEDLQMNFDRIVPMISHPFSHSQAMQRITEAQNAQEQLIRQLTNTKSSLSLQAAVAAVMKKKANSCLTSPASDIQIEDNCSTNRTLFNSNNFNSNNNNNKTNSPTAPTTMSLSTAAMGVSSKSKKISKRCSHSSNLNKAHQQQQLQLSGTKTNDISTLIPSLKFSEGRDLNLNTPSRQNISSTNFSADAAQYHYFNDKSQGVRSRNLPSAMLEFSETPSHLHSAQQHQMDIRFSGIKPDMMSPRKVGAHSMQSLDEDILGQPNPLHHHHMMSNTPFDEIPYHHAPPQHMKLKRHMSDPYGDFYQPMSSYANHHHSIQHNQLQQQSYATNAYHQPLNDLMSMGYEADIPYDATGACLNNEMNNANMNKSDNTFKKEDDDDQLYYGGYNSQNETFEELLNDGARCQPLNANDFISSNNMYGGGAYEDCNNTPVGQMSSHVAHHAFSHQHDDQINTIGSMGSLCYNNNNNNNNNSTKQRTSSAATDLLDCSSHRRNNEYEFYGYDRRTFSNNSAIL